jgi:5-methylcytosine-specific restriction endonuclease McrA
MPTEIKITCKGSSSVPLETLQNFQGNLKTLEKPGWDVSGLRLSKSNKIYKSKQCVVPIICDHCGGKGWNPLSNFIKSKTHFCNITCYQNSDRKKTICLNAGRNKDRISRLILRNKTPENSKKVSISLKKRKIKLGDHYHSKSTKRKIGEATKDRWQDKKFSILPVLLKNSQKVTDKTKYGHTFKVIRKSLIKKFDGCLLCDETKYVAAHHILPVRFGGETDILNLIPLCRRCHKKIETFEWRFFNRLAGDNFSESESWYMVYAYFNRIFRVLIGARYE